jgi:hypothetical protein
LRQDGHFVWAPSDGAAVRAIPTFGVSIQRLQLPDGIGDEHPRDGVESAGLMPDLHVLPGIRTPVKGYGVLLKRLRSLGYRDISPDPAAPWQTTIDGLAPGAYTIDVTGISPGSPLPPVGSDILVWA